MGIPWMRREVEWGWRMEWRWGLRVGMENGEQGAGDAEGHGDGMGRWNPPLTSHPGVLRTSFQLQRLLPASSSWCFAQAPAQKKSGLFDDDSDDEGAPFAAAPLATPERSQLLPGDKEVCPGPRRKPFVRQLPLQQVPQPCF